MPASTVHCTVKLRSDTAANWTSADPVLGQGEMVIEYDTFKFKIGNGTDCWNDITNPYLVNTGDIEIADKITHIGDTDTAIRFPANDTFTIETAGTEAFRVDSNQKILIGGPTASYANASSGNFQVGVHTSATATGITIGGTSTNSISFADDGDDQAGLIKYTHSDNSLSFHTDGATNQRMTIDSSGNIFIGGTTAATADIALNASGSASFASAVEVTSGLRMFRTAGDSSKRVNIGESDTLAVWQNDGNFTIKYDGTASFAGTVSAQGSVLTSDQRFKKNITDANSQLADVTALGNKLRNWDWSADAPVADKSTRFLGLVAQEAETVCPGIVTTIARTKDGAELTPEVVVPAVYETKTVPAVLDSEGKVVEAETTKQVLVTAEQVTPATYEELDDSYKGIKNDILIMKLLGAVAELSAKVAALEAG